MARKPELLSLAESVADGTPVDWETLETHATAVERPVIQQLRILSDLVGLHRTLALDPAARAPVPRPVPSAAPAIGSWGHLALLERLGGGMFGEVYRAWDRQLERDVALKLLRGEASADDPLASRIAAEGRMLARVRHPNVITVYGAAVNDGRVGLWMELVRGATLEQLLQERGPFGAREAALIGIDLCRALAALHEAGLIHRDVKAQNVMREDGGRVVLMDLGTGRERGEPGPHTAPDMAGTPLYLAPEIFGGGPASARTDLYSLGVLLYRLVTASFPVRAATMEDLRAAHAGGRRVRLRDARADLPTAFVRVVDRAIDSDPEHRYETAGELEADLVGALDETASPGVGKRAGRGWHAPLLWALLLGAAVIFVIAVVTGYRWTPSEPATAPAAASVRSVAVLPLVNLSGDPSQQYFADGMTDELISTLGRVAGLDVISRTSVMQFKATNTPIPEIAQRLRVGTVLEGSLLVVPGGPAAAAGSQRVRITARLLSAGTDTQLWNRTFERDMTDVLRLQSEIAAAVAEGIGVELLRDQPSDGQAGAPAGAQPPQSPDAFDLYLRGRYQWNLRTREGINRSIQYFREAIDRDPKFARAYAGLADAYSLLPIYGLVPRADASKQAEAAARTALELDPSLAEAHASLGLIRMERLEWDAAAASFDRALQLKPGIAAAHHWYAAFLTRRGQFDEALKEIRRALELDPLSAVVTNQHAAILVQARQYDEAIARFEEALRLDPSFAARTHMALAEAYAFKGDYARALAETERSAALGGSGVELSANIGYIHARAGRRAQASKVADGLAGQFRSNQDGAAYAAAAVYAGLRDSERAFEWLARARDRRENAIADLKADPRFDSVRDDPRYEKLLAAIGLSR